MTDTVIYLIAETHARNDFGADVTTETRRKVFCSLKSVGRSEFYAAEQIGLALDHVFITNPINYKGERIVEYQGDRYEVTRTYQPTNDTLEIYAGHKAGVFQ